MKYFPANAFPLPAWSSLTAPQLNLWQTHSRSAGLCYGNGDGELGSKSEWSQVKAAAGSYDAFSAGVIHRGGLEEGEARLYLTLRLVWMRDLLKYVMRWSFQVIFQEPRGKRKYKHSFYKQINSNEKVIHLLHYFVTFLFKLAIT